MSDYRVAVTKYRENAESVKKAVEMSDAFKNLPSNAKVVLKPNIVYWSMVTDFPKWGVITTSYVMEEIVKLLHDYGISNITIVEGMNKFDSEDREIFFDACERLGYNKLKERYNVMALDVYDRPFEKVDFFLAQIADKCIQRIIDKLR